MKKEIYNDKIKMAGAFLEIAIVKDEYKELCKKLSSYFYEFNKKTIYHRKYSYLIEDLVDENYDLMVKVLKENNQEDDENEDF